MTRRDGEVTLRPSVIDRLIEGDQTVGLAARESADHIRRSVMRDLESLLNTRRTIEPAPEGFPELRKSLYHYGLADLTSYSADHSATASRLARQIEELIRLFEPRMTAVRVTVPEMEKEASRRRMHFIIEATLDLDPVPQDIVFDTVLDVARGSFDVGADGHA